MLKFRTFLFFFLCIVCHGYSQVQPIIKKTEGIGEVLWEPERESKNQVRQKARNLAEINALEKAFGTAVIQGNTVYMSNITTGQKVETKTIFNMIGNTMVRGEIIEVLDSAYEELVSKRQIAGKSPIVTNIRCKITVMAKEITSPKLEIETFTMKSIDIIKQESDFNEGEYLFLFFKSPENGYITVFLDDNKVAQCLIPYINMPKGFENGMAVVANKNYIFFSQKKSDYFKENNDFIDELELGVTQPRELNRIFVIYTKTPIDKPKLRQDLGNLSADEIKQGFQLPKSVESEAFQRWLAKNHQLRSDMQVENIMISISKR